MKRFQNILYVAEENALNVDALVRSVNLANNNNARLTVLQITEGIPNEFNLFKGKLSLNKLQDELVADLLSKLDDLVAPWQKTVAIETEILVGVAFLETVSKVLRDKHDLVIKLAESEIHSQAFASNDMHLLRKCPCPVWLFKPNSPQRFRKIVAAVDVNDFYDTKEQEKRHALNYQILEMAISLAISEFSELHIVHVWEPIGENILSGPARLPEEEMISFVEEIKLHHKKNLAHFMQQTIAKLGQQTIEYVEPKMQLLEGKAPLEIPAFTNRIKADLIVMGTVARSGIPGYFMGNTAEKIINRIDCSVLAIKPPGFVSPVTLEK